MTTRTQVKALVGSSGMRTAAEQLLHATRGCRPDMHDAELTVGARVTGRLLDNAGTPNELTVLFTTGHDLSLATLTALARVGAARLLEEAGHGAP